MSLRVDESALTTSSNKELATAHQGACAVVYQAICAEAIRVIFALHALSQSGVAELRNELRRCETAMSERCRSPLEVSRPFSSQCHVGSSSLFQRTSSHGGTLVRPQNQDNGDTLRVLPSSTEARGCVTNASLYGLLTAAHLLRCSTWTAASLVQGVWVDRHSALEQVPQFVAQAQAAEDLRTRESGWCATALVQFTEWLLFSLSPPFLSSPPSALLSRALSVEEVGRTATDCGGVVLGSGSPVGSAASGAPRDAVMLTTHQRTVFVADTLPLYFPFLLNGKKGSRSFFVPSPRQPFCVVGTLESRCAHRWLLDDLPRWCAQVALDEQSKRWHRTSLLQKTLERWQVRRGFRVVAHLSHAAVSASGAELYPLATPANSSSPLTQTTTPVYAVVRRVGEGALASPSGFVDASKAATFSKRIATHTMEGVPHIDKVVSGGSGEPPTWNLRGGLAADVSTIADDTASPPSIQSQDTRRTGLPAADLFAYTSHADTAAATPKAHRLDSLLRGELTIQNLPLRNMCVAGHTSILNENCDRDRLERQRETASQQGRGHTGDSSSDTSTAASTSFSKHSTPEGASRFSDEEAKQEERARVLVQRRETAVAREVFLYWRDRRLYESLAARFLQTQRRESTRARCWAQWKRRRAAILQRDKETRDVARCDVYTEQKALQYFRALLQRWRKAALVRRFRVFTVGYRVLRAWECNTRFAQAQRGIQQSLRIERQVKWQVWTRWRERHQERVADGHRVQKHAAATLLLLKHLCVRRQTARVATSQHNTIVLKRALQRWTLQYRMAIQLRSFIESKHSRNTVARQVWQTWRLRWLEQQLRREQEDRVRVFRVERLAEVCFARWVQRWRRETDIRACVGRQQRRHILRPLFLQWHRRMQVCFIVRQAQEELALKVSEQLSGRRTLRTWHRKATQHAARRRGLLDALMDEEADSFVRISRLGRTFYHWRAHSFVRRRYNLDRRSGLPVSAHGAAVMRSVRGHDVVFRITGVGHHSEADTGNEDFDSSTNPAPMKPLPPPPSSAASSSVSPGRAQRGPLKCGRRAPTRSVVSVRSPKRLPDHRCNATFVHQSTLAAAAALDEPASTWFGSTNEDGHAAALATPHGGRRFVASKQLAIPLRRRAVALQRQLLTMQPQQKSLFSRNVCVRDVTTGSQSTPPSGPLLSQLTHMISLGPRRTAHPRREPPFTTPRQHWNNNLSGSDADGQTPRRSRTATPLFTPCEDEGALRSRRSAALVESPHPSSPPPPRQPHRGAHGRSNDDAAHRFGSASTDPAHRLLGQMEQLLRRIRVLEAGYPAQEAAAV
ncbi:hypothetical protein, conserved [Leishmania tarentolae]|uniref:Sfi1 spindle body domain-containing protein n=1 Tax=Leishmania tarentolae TaxID=5689 RepID=A0A640KRR9_LEITA|nr:hypothetical protein, conserved [Leishmania tarentolae]